MDLREKFIEGEVLLIDKNYKWTSFDVVNKIRWIINKKLGIKKIKAGHTGTLDPLATGLVIVCTGKATKRIENFLNLDKEYVFTMKLGETTASYDLETEVRFVKDPGNISLDDVKKITDKYIGDIMQVPPHFSAKYICGTRAYEYARKGIIIEMEPVAVKINSLEILNFNPPYVELKTVCSKGTYIRSLVRDIGNGLNCGAYLAELRRTAIGDFNVNSSVTISEFEKKISSPETFL